MKEIFHAEEKYEFSDNVGRINCVFFFSSKARAGNEDVARSL